MSSSTSDNQSTLSNVKTLITAVGSVAATVVVVRSVSNELIPPEISEYFISTIRSFLTRFSSNFTLVIEEYEGLVKNEIYDAAETYLGPKISPYTRRLKISRPEKAKNFNIAMERGETVEDLFEGEIFKWVWVCSQNETNTRYDRRQPAIKVEVRSFELTFKKKNRDLAIDSYLPHILNLVEKIKHEKKTLQIYTACSGSYYYLSEVWQSVTLDHPSTFDTLAMDPDQKNMILKDLDRFVKRKDYYKKVGKAWKRGYLLYGPPGTGKSSLIGAIANYLNFDVYDLELSDVHSNSDLRKMLMATANKSILVVEDIDCTIDFQKKLAKRKSSKSSETEDVMNEDDEEESKVTLSGLLNFVDGLWSTCGTQRILIFTTNHIEKLDPALLRPGRMDMHINMSYCTAGGFKVLALNYLGIEDHPRFEEIIGLIEKVNVTPAEVAEQLLKNDDHEVALQDLVEFIHRKSREDDLVKMDLGDTEGLDETEEGYDS